MRKADIVVGEEYRTSAGRTYSYNLRRVVVEFVGARKANDWAFQNKAAEELGATREWVQEQRNNPDLSRNEAEARIAAKRVEVDKRAAELLKGNEYVKDGKGGGILVRVLDAKTGKDVPLMRYSSARREHQQVAPVTRMVIESREFDCTWAEWLVKQEQNQVYAAKQEAERQEREERRAREVEALRAALPEGVKFGTSAHGEGTIELDRGYGYSQSPVAMSRATLAKLLGIELPGAKEVTD